MTRRGVPSEVRSEEPGILALAVFVPTVNKGALQERKREREIRLKGAQLSLGDQFSVVRFNIFRNYQSLHLVPMCTVTVRGYLGERPAWREILVEDQ